MEAFLEKEVLYDNCESGIFPSKKGNILWVRGVQGSGSGHKRLSLGFLRR